jgi:hypothetical protein
VPEDAAVVLCGDDELAYRDNRTPFVDGEGLRLDESYRLAHLPLVAPDHPRAIARQAGKSYDRGRHGRVVSLVVPVPPEALRGSPAARALDSEIRASCLAHKIAWHIVDRRQHRLHATVCGSLASGERLAMLDTVQRDALARLGPLTVELRGLFSGSLNIGRLYIRAYPEKRSGIDMFRRLQQIMGCRETMLYVVGLYNLVDDLEAAEAAALARLIDRWWDKPIARFHVPALWLLAAYDDLVLDGEIVETIALG